MKKIHSLSLWVVKKKERNVYVTEDGTITTVLNKAEVFERAKPKQRYLDTGEEWLEVQLIPVTKKAA